MATREFLRRHALCNRSPRDADDRTPGAFGELKMDFELEASALLFLRQAVEGYKVVRPTA
jgi:hypothetical protein